MSGFLFYAVVTVYSLPRPDLEDILSVRSLGTFWGTSVVMMNLFENTYYTMMPGGYHYHNPLGS